MTHDEEAGHEEAGHLRQKDGSFDLARVVGYVIVVLALVPLLGWLYQYVAHIHAAPSGQPFEPAIVPGDVWKMSLPMLAVGLTISYGQGRKLANVLLERLKR